jgi:hypothetical protein
VYGVTPNIFHATIQGFLNVESSIFDDLENFDYRDLPKQLYTAEGNILNKLERKILGDELREREREREGGKPIE